MMVVNNKKTSTNINGFIDIPFSLIIPLVQLPLLQWVTDAGHAHQGTPVGVIPAPQLRKHTHHLIMFQQSHTNGLPRSLTYKHSHTLKCIVTPLKALNKSESLILDRNSRSREFCLKQHERLLFSKSCCFWG